MFPEYSADKPAAGRMVGAVNLRVAIDATTVRDTSIGRGCRESLPGHRIHRGRGCGDGIGVAQCHRATAWQEVCVVVPVMTRSHTLMALLTQPWRTRIKQGGVGGPVWGVTIHAILDHRGMFPQERTALLRVAGIAGFADRTLDHHFWTDRAVRIMTIGTAHLAGSERVRRRAVRQGALGLVTTEANLGLDALAQYLVALDVNLVAGGAGHLLAGVLAAVPVRATVALVTAQARLAARFGRGYGVLAESAFGRRWLAAALVSPVLFAFAVAIGTSRGALVCLDAVFGLANGQDSGFRVAHEASSRRFICFVVASGTFCIALEDQVLGGVGGQRRRQGLKAQAQPRRTNSNSSLPLLHVSSSKLHARVLS